MAVVSSREELMEKIVLLLCYSGQTVLQLIPDDLESSKLTFQDTLVNLIFHYKGCHDIKINIIANYNINYVAN